MPKKIYDIKPPEEQRFQAREGKDTKNCSGGFFLKVGAIILAIFSIVYFFTFRVEVEIWPRTDAVELEKLFSVDISEEVLNSVLPATIFETDFFEEIRTFSATGTETAETKATGTVTIENRHWDNNQPLIEGTRFESPDGKIFRAKDGVVVPGRRYEGGNIIPGKVEVEVIADEPGREYNIEPTEFILPGLRGAPSYEGVRAVSEKSMIGGAIGERTVVSQEDIERGREEVLQALLRQGKNILMSQKGEDFLFDHDSQFNYEIEAEEVSARPGEEADSFTVKIRTRIDSLTFREEDLRTILKKSILTEVDPIDEQNLERELKVYKESLSFNYGLENVDWERGTAQLRVNFVGEVYSSLSDFRLKEIAMGKSRSELESFLNNQDFIRESRVRFKPFGIGGVPDNSERIKIKTNFN